jgi:hypothetical protein
MRKMEGFPLSDLEEMRDSLYQNLEKGYTYIEQKLEKGEDTREAEDYWQELLKQYNMVTEEIRHKIGASDGAKDPGQARGEGDQSLRV